MNQQIKSYRKSGNIVIEIPEETLIFAVENNPEDGVKVTDREKFLHFITDNLIEEVGFSHDTGLSSFHRLMDEAANRAVEMDEGVEAAE